MRGRVRNEYFHRTLEIKITRTQGEKHKFRKNQEEKKEGGGVEKERD